jgi:hypothetical protein
VRSMTPGAPEDGVYVAFGRFKGLRNHIDQRVLDTKLRHESAHGVVPCVRLTFVGWAGHSGVAITLPCMRCGVYPANGASAGCNCVFTEWRNTHRAPVGGQRDIRQSIRCWPNWSRIP